MPERVVEFCEMEEEDVESGSTLQSLTEKHCDTYTVPKQWLWAGTIHCGTYGNYETPPPLPIFRPPSKDLKQMFFQT